MKRTLLWMVGALLLLSVMLYAFTRVSDSYSMARSTILNSSHVSDKVGIANLTILLGANYKLRPNSISCGRLTFFVSGEKGSEFIEVLVRKVARRGWTVYDVLMGSEAYTRKVCETVATASSVIVSQEVVYKS